MKKTYAQRATELGITEITLRRYAMQYLQSEGHDDVGNEYETLDDYIASKRKLPVEALRADNRGTGGYDDNREQ